MSFKTISDDEYQTWTEGLQEEESDNFAKIESEIGIAISNLKSQHPQLAKICELLNKKISLATSNNPTAHTFLNDGEVKPINLSACGIAFKSDENLDENQSILLQLKLKPSNVAIVTTGKVVDAGTGNQDNTVRINFQNLGESNQDLLMQHLFHVQGRVLKKQRASE